MCKERPCTFSACCLARGTICLHSRLFCLLPCRSSRSHLRCCQYGRVAAEGTSRSARCCLTEALGGWPISLGHQLSPGSHPACCVLRIPCAASPQGHITPRPPVTIHTTSRCSCWWPAPAPSPAGPGGDQPRSLLRGPSPINWWFCSAVSPALQQIPDPCMYLLIPCCLLFV